VYCIALGWLIQITPKDITNNSSSGKDETRVRYTISIIPQADRIAQYLRAINKKIMKCKNADHSKY
jgi:hypothetical protein